MKNFITKLFIKEPNEINNILDLFSEKNKKLMISEVFNKINLNKLCGEIKFRYNNYVIWFKFYNENDTNIFISYLNKNNIKYNTDNYRINPFNPGAEIYIVREENINNKNMPIKNGIKIWGCSHDFSSPYSIGGWPESEEKCCKICGYTYKYR